MNELNIVAQSNHLVRGIKRDGITLREQKLLYTVISMIDKDDDELKEYKIGVRQLFQLIGVAKRTPAKSLKDTAEKLTTRSFELPVMNGGKNDFDFINVISRCQYIEKEGTLTVVINPLIKPFLLKLQRDFTTYKLYNILKLKSEYSISIFQYLKSYAFQGSVTVQIDDLRKFLFFDTTLHMEYAYFKRDVLKKSLNEINKKTDIEVTFEEIKEGRRVTAIKFIITEKDNAVQVEEVAETTLWDTQKVYAGLIIESLGKKGVAISALDASNLADQAYALWGTDAQPLTDLLQEIVDNIEQVKSPSGFLKYLFKQFEANHALGYPYRQGFEVLFPPKEDIKQARGRSEAVPDWFKSYKSGEQLELLPEDTKPKGEIDFEAERRKVLKKIGYPDEVINKG